MASLKFQQPSYKCKNVIFDNSKIVFHTADEILLISYLFFLHNLLAKKDICNSAWSALECKFTVFIQFPAATML